MTIAETAQVLQLILAPAVMITTSGILTNGLLGHYQSVSDRLRGLARERLELVSGGTALTTLGREHLAEIDYELPRLLRRHRHVHDALLALSVSIALFIACMAAIGAAAAWPTFVPLSNLVLILFGAGLVSILVGALRAAVEIRTSNEAIGWEVRRVIGLRLDPPGS